MATALTVALHLRTTAANVPVFVVAILVVLEHLSLSRIFFDQDVLRVAYPNQLGSFLYNSSMSFKP
jgi:hypothetical protein